jgi:hypothetical protein
MKSIPLLKIPSKYTYTSLFTVSLYTVVCYMFWHYIHVIYNIVNKKLLCVCSWTF